MVGAWACRNFAARVQCASTTAAFGVVYAVSILVAGGLAVDNVDGGLAGGIIASGSVPLYVGVGAAAIGIGVSAVLPTVLVALDAPEE